MNEWKGKIIVDIEYVLKPRSENRGMKVAGL